MDDVIAILDGIRPGKNFSAARNFFDEGVLDSLDLTTLVAELESRYGVFIDVNEIVAENFCNVVAIRATLTRKGAKL